MKGSTGNSDLGHCEVIAVTDESVLVYSDLHGRLWIPKDVVHGNSLKKGEKKSVAVKAWWYDRLF